jgi:RND family efflux transporter MFP subunit
MSEADTSSPQAEKSSDALSKLRINRDADARPRSGSARTRGYLAFLVVLIVICARPEVRVASVTVESGRSADATVVATGYLESRRQAKIGARAPGRIEIVNVEEGSRVKKESILAVLEHADLEASLSATQATLARSQSELVEHEIEIDRSKRAFDRAETLYNENSLSESDFDQAKFSYKGAVARRDSLAAAVNLAEARVREAEQLKENMYIRAPFDGTVISKDAEVGESILPGGLGDASGRGSVVTIADLEHLEVDCDVKEDYISRVVAGQAAEVLVDAVPDHRYQARVRKIIPMGDRARATIKVKVEILDVDARLFPEMSCTAYFLPEATREASDTEERRVFCPSAAVQTDGADSYVWVVAQDDRVQRVDVETVAERDGRAEVATGLSGGEHVVTDPPEGLREGQLVKVAQ